MRTAKNPTRVVGKVVLRKLADVRPNSWNPNRMTPTEKAALKHGLRTDGWLISQSLLVWGTDERGKRHDVIIDGEHRWTAAGELGFAEGPMVFLDGLSEARAKALTIKMYTRRGEHAAEPLSELVHELVGTLDVPDLGLELGFGAEQLADILGTNAPASSASPSTPPPAPARSSGSRVKQVQLMFNLEQHEQWQAAIGLLSERFGTPNVTDTALAAVRELTAPPAVETNAKRKRGRAMMPT